MEIAIIAAVVLLAVNILIVLRIVKSAAAEMSKVSWVAAVLVLPVVAHIAWYLVGPGRPE